MTKGKNAIIIILIVLIIGLSSFFLIKQYKKIDDIEPIEKEKMYLKARNPDYNYINATYYIFDNKTNIKSEGVLSKSSWAEIDLEIPLEQYELCAFSKEYHYNCEDCQGYQCTVELSRIGEMDINLIRTDNDTISLRVINTIEQSTINNILICVGWTTGTLTTGYIRFYSNYPITQIPDEISSKYYKCFDTGATITTIGDFELKHDNYQLTENDSVRVIVIDKEQRKDDFFYYQNAKDIGAENKEIEVVI